MHPFQISHLDHVAINVKDLQRSADWYEKVLGLKKVQPKEWGEYPIFMLSGTTGIAIFPSNLNDPECPSNSQNIKIDHFAFYVSNTEFKKAIDHYKNLGIDNVVKDHIHFHSVYVHDPDGHTVELTTIIGDKNDFYNL